MQSHAGSNAKELKWVVKRILKMDTEGAQRRSSTKERSIPSPELI